MAGIGLIAIVSVLVLSAGALPKFNSDAPRALRGGDHAAVAALRTFVASLSMSGAIPTTAIPSNPAMVARLKHS